MGSVSIDHELLPQVNDSERHAPLSETAVRVSVQLFADELLHGFNDTRFQMCVQEHPQDGVIVLKNGCMCCTAGGVTHHLVPIIGFPHNLVIPRFCVIRWWE